MTKSTFGSPRAATFYRLARKRAIIKMLLVMKLTMILFIVAIFSAHASSMAQNVTLSGKDLTIKEVFTAIKKQTGYLVLHDQELFSDKVTISLSANSLPLSECLDMILKDRQIDYDIQGKTIFLTRRMPSGQPSMHVWQPPMPIIIRVVGPDGKPLAGASVKNRNAKSSGITGAEGELNIEVSIGDVLDISFIGFTSQSVAIKDRSSAITVSLKPATNDLDEMVFKGYYGTSKRLNTGSVSKVTSSTIEKQPVNNPMLALSGRVPGLSIQEVSGIPGGFVTIRIRGKNSIRYEGNDPLFIIDGVPFPSTTLTSNYSTPAGVTPSPFQNINPADIESIEVLKDADATAIYGSRGANGVVLITTKRGKAGKTKLDINVYTGRSHVPRTMKMLNTQQYLEMRREAFKNDGVTPTIANAPDLLVWDTTRYTDWQKVMLGNAGITTDAQASLSGGSANTQFLLGAGYRNETIIYPGDYNNRKLSSHININHQSTDKRFKADFTASYMNNVNVLPTSDFSYTIGLPPNAPPIYDEKGNLNWADGTWDNPFAPFNKTHTSTTDNLITNLNLSLQILPGLYLKSSLGYTLINHHELRIEPLTSMNPDWQPVSGSSLFYDNNIRTWIAEPQANYNFNAGAGRFEIIAGATFQQNVQDKEVLNATGFPSDEMLRNLRSASTVTVYNSDYSNYKYNAVFAKVNYNHADKYLINITGRRDGSSRFGPGRQFANFGSAGAAWVISEEPFMNALSSVVSFAKLRTSYGYTGNDQIGDYSFMDTYTAESTVYQGRNGLTPTRLFNPDFGWETTTKFEAALEMGFYNNKLMLTAAYYRNRSFDQLVGIALPSVSGFTSLSGNLPAKVQNTGLELEINTTNIQKKNFTWTSGFSITIPKNILLAYPNIESSSYATQYQVGRSLFMSKSYSVTGIDPNTGIYTFLDVDKDGNYSYPNDYLINADRAEKYYGGIYNNIQYKNWQLDVFFSFMNKVTGNYLYTWFFGMPGGMGNQPTFVLDRWQKPGDVTNIQKFTQDYASPTARSFSMLTSSNYAFDKTLYARLKNLSLSYSLPQQLLSKAHISNCSFYFQGQNLFTFSGLKGMDPENAIALPPLRVFTAGIRLTL